MQQLFDKIEKNDKTIVLAWVSSHKDIYRNTIINIKVKTAAIFKIDSQPIYNTYSDINKRIKILLKQSWTTTWKAYKASLLHKSIGNFFDL